MADGKLGTGHQHRSGKFMGPGVGDTKTGGKSWWGGGGGTLKLEWSVDGEVGVGSRSREFMAVGVGKGQKLQGQINRKNSRNKEREGKNPLLGKQQILPKPLAKLKFCNNNSA